jgi:hypothetical protein
MRSPGAISRDVKLTEVPGRIVNTLEPSGASEGWVEAEGVEWFRPYCQDGDDDP